MDAQAPTLPKAVARLCLKLRKRGYTLEANELEAAAAEQVGSSVTDLIGALHRSTLPPLEAAVARNIETREQNQVIDQASTRHAWSLLRNHIEPHPIARKPLDEISHDDLDAYFHQLAAKRNGDGTFRLGPTPRRTIHGLLNQTIATAVTAGTLVANPMAAIPRPAKQKAASAQFASRPNATTFLAELSGRIPYEDYLRQFPLFFGLRTSERLALQHRSFAPAAEHDWLDTFEATTELRVLHQLAEGSDRQVTALKTERSRATSRCPSPSSPTWTPSTCGGRPS